MFVKLNKTIIVSCLVFLFSTNNVDIVVAKQHLRNHVAKNGRQLDSSSSIKECRLSSNFDSQVCFDEYLRECEIMCPGPDYCGGDSNTCLNEATDLCYGLPETVQPNVVISGDVWRRPDSCEWWCGTACLFYNGGTGLFCSHLYCNGDNPFSDDSYDHTCWAKIEGNTSYNCPQHYDAVY